MKALKSCLRDLDRLHAIPDGAASPQFRGWLQATRGTLKMVFPGGKQERLLGEITFGASAIPWARGLLASKTLLEGLLKDVEARPTPVLPPPSPARTALCRDFETSIASLNDFYWGTAASSFTLRHLSAQQPAVLPTLPAEVSKHWNVAAKKVASRLDGNDRTLCETTVVHAVAKYEDFLREILRLVLAKGPWSGRILKVDQDLGALPLSPEAVALMRSEWVEDESRRLASYKYPKRHAQVEKALASAATGRLPAIKGNFRLLTATFQVRNVIVHQGGVADAVAVEALKGTIPTVLLGVPLPLDAKLVQRLLGSLLEHVQAVDHAVTATWPALAVP